MPTNVDFTSIPRLGSNGQVLVRRPSDASGAAWEDSNAFTVKTKTAATFLSGPTRLKRVVVTVTDGGVVSTSQVQASVQLASGRASDEAEMDPVIAVVGAITEGTSVVVTLVPASTESVPHGAYTVNYARV